MRIKLTQNRRILSTKITTKQMIRWPENVRKLHKHHLHPQSGKIKTKINTLYFHKVKGFKKPHYRKNIPKLIVE